MEKMEPDSAHSGPEKAQQVNSRDLQQGRFLLSIGKSLSLGCILALAWVPQEAEESPSLEVLRRHLNEALSNLNQLGVLSASPLLLGLWLGEFGARSERQCS